MRSEVYSALSLEEKLRLLVVLVVAEVSGWTFRSAYILSCVHDMCVIRCLECGAILFACEGYVLFDRRGITQAEHLMWPRQASQFERRSTLATTYHLYQTRERFIT